MTLAHAIDTHPYVAIGLLVIVALLLAFGIVKGLLALFIDWADGPDPDVADHASEVTLHRDWPPPIKLAATPLAQKLTAPITPTFHDPGMPLHVLDRKVRR